MATNDLVLNMVPLDDNTHALATTTMLRNGRKLGFFTISFRPEFGLLRFLKTIGQTFLAFEKMQ
jgi:hypothetical protein